MEINPEEQYEGIIIKIHSNYYYVESHNISWECMLRNKLKKSGIEPKVGDKVLIDQLNPENNTAVITEVAERKNELVKPNIANVDQIIIIMSPKEPEFNPILLDKFLVLVESRGIMPIICVNKSDKLESELKDYINDIFKDTGYLIFYISAKAKIGVDSLKEKMVEKITVLTGASGVGKSSLINALDPSLNLVTAEVSESIGVGRHTTRHVSLQKLFFNGKLALIADTPGFSYIDFNNINSRELGWYFREFTPYIPDCAMRDCIHWQEPGCKVKENIDTEGSRYNNYLSFLMEIIELEKVSNARSSKKEDKVKYSKKSSGKQITVVKLDPEARESSRRVIKQELSEMGKINSLEDFDEDY